MQLGFYNIWGVGSITDGRKWLIGHFSHYFTQALFIPLEQQCWLMKNQQPHWVRDKLRFNFYHPSTISRYLKEMSLLVSHSRKNKAQSMYVVQIVWHNSQGTFLKSWICCHKNISSKGSWMRRGEFGRYRIGTLWDGDWFTCRWCFCLLDWKKKPFGANGPEKKTCQVLQITKQSSIIWVTIK